MSFIEHIPRKIILANKKDRVAFSVRKGILIIKIVDSILANLNWKVKDKIKVFYDSDFPMNLKLIKSSDQWGFKLVKPAVKSKELKLQIGKMNYFNNITRSISYAEHFIDTGILFLRLNAKD